ncbi:DUF2125 domain-containing protein [Chelativorans sp.]|uniref:DUF2125 domain-containing protein n=1 Tax=Chelativorans sp. TaxID=2203393 RepID=UPI0028112456|nr:DUF2125 domain-containing protein [Chelativorans sp.]
MASRAGSRFFRRILWLGVLVILLVGAYSAAWFYLARELENRAAAAMASVNGGGVRAFCEEPQARGFPFRIGLFCKSVFYEDVREGVSVRAGELRSTANVYQPFRILGELSGPASLMLPHTVPLQAQWESLRASTRLARPLPERMSVEGKAIVISAQGQEEAPLATVEDLQIHARRLEADLETALSFAGLGIGDEVAPDLPPLEGRARVLVLDGVALIASRPESLRGQSARIEEMVVGVVGEQAALTLSGPVAVDDNGLVDAELSVKVDDPAAVLQLMAQIFPDNREQIMGVSGIVGGLGNAPLQIRIVKGQAFLGFIPLGAVPAL